LLNVVVVWCYWTFFINVAVKLWITFHLCWPTSMASFVLVSVDFRQTRRSVSASSGNVSICQHHCWWQCQMWIYIKEWHGSGIGGITAVSMVLQEWVLILWYYHIIGFKVHGNPVGMGTRLAVLPQLWGWVYVNCEPMHELGSVQLQVSVDQTFIWTFICILHHNFSQCTVTANVWSLC